MKEKEYIKITHSVYFNRKTYFIDYYLELDQIRNNNRAPFYLQHIIDKEIKNDLNDKLTEIVQEITDTDIVSYGYDPKIEHSWVFEKEELTGTYIWEIKIDPYMNHSLVFFVECKEDSLVNDYLGVTELNVRYEVDGINDFTIKDIDIIL